MIVVVQRVSEASVSVAGRPIAAIGQGLLVLVGVAPEDGTAQIEQMAQRLLKLRVFADSEQRMNLSVRDVQGEVLLVPQFTLLADISKGLRPSFLGAGSPEQAHQLFDQLVATMKKAYAKVQQGEFGAHMSVALVNDGPVTFHLEIK